MNFDGASKHMINPSSRHFNNSNLQFYLTSALKQDFFIHLKLFMQK